MKTIKCYDCKGTGRIDALDMNCGRVASECCGGCSQEIDCPQCEEGIINLENSFAEEIYVLEDVFNDIQSKLESQALSKSEITSAKNYLVELVTNKNR